MAVYKGLEATLHEAFWGERGSDLEVSDILRLFPDFQGRALEVGAGSGRILRPLKEAGWQIEGIEPASEMVNMYEEGEGNEAPLFQTTLEELYPDQKYDLIILTSYVFQILGEPEEVLSKVSELLKEGGQVYISLMIPWAEIVGEIIEGEWSVDDEVKLSDGRKARCWVNFQIDRVQQRLTRQHRYELLEKKKAVEVTETEQEIRWFTLPEMSLRAEIAGYKITALSYDFKDAYDSDAHSLGLVLSNKGEA